MKTFRNAIWSVTLALLAIVPITSCSGGKSQETSMETQLAQFKQAVDSLHAVYASAAKGTLDEAKAASKEAIDSTGYYIAVETEKMKEKIREGRDKYFSGDSVNTSLLYDDMTKYLKESGIDVNKDSIKAKLLPYVDQISKLLVEYKASKPSVEEVLDKLTGMAQLMSGYSRQDMEALYDFVASEYDFCTTLTAEQLNSYANDVKRLIQESGVLSEEMKETLTFTTQTVIGRLQYDGK